MIRTPAELLKTIVLPKVSAESLTPDKAIELMIATWEAEYVPLRLYAPVEQEVVQNNDTVSSSEPVSSGIDDLWGDDLGETWQTSASI